LNTAVANHTSNARVRENCVYCSDRSRETGRHTGRDNFGYRDCFKRPELFSSRFYTRQRAIQRNFATTGWAKRISRQTDGRL